MKHLRIYYAIRLIQRQGSIRRAAELLAVSPSALNRSVQTFEDSIGVHVFERVPAGVRLTPAGELLLDVVERHLIEFEELQRQLGRLRDGHAGTLRVAIGDDIAAGLPLLALNDLEAEMPGVSTSVSGGDAMGLLRQREIDLAIVTNPETDKSVEVLASQNVRLVACATRHWGGAGSKPGLWDLAADRVVLPPDHTGSRTVISHAFRRHALEERTVKSVAAPHLWHAMGHGARTCIFPRTVFDDPGAPAGLRWLAIDVGAVQVSVLRLSGVPLSRAAQSLLKYMERRLDAEV